MPELIHARLTQPQRQSGIWHVIIRAHPPPDQGQQGSALLKPTDGSHWLNGVGEEDIWRGGGALKRDLHGVSEGLGSGAQALL